MRRLEVEGDDVKGMLEIYRRIGCGQMEEQRWSDRRNDFRKRAFIFKYSTILVI